MNSLGLFFLFFFTKNLKECIHVLSKRNACFLPTCMAVVRGINCKSPIRGRDLICLQNTKRSIDSVMDQGLLSEPLPNEAGPVQTNSPLTRSFTGASAALWSIPLSLITFSSTIWKL